MIILYLIIGTPVAMCWLVRTAAIEELPRSLMSRTLGTSFEGPSTGWAVLFYSKGGRAMKFLLK